MQTISWTACGLPTHWKKQIPGPPPFARQSKKQVTSSAQLGSARQAMIGSQQLCATQSPHGVPSDGQSGGGLQVPPSQSLEQHSSSPLHADPSGRQLPEQTPAASQTPLQHCSDTMQGAPSGVHGGAQVPPAQLSLQHSPSPMQAAPTGAHGAAQTPISQLPEQQSGSILHMEPSGAQASAQTPISHCPLQHCAPFMHPPPARMQPAQIPLSHALLQHSRLVLHPAPLGAHGPQRNPHCSGT